MKDMNPLIKKQLESCKNASVEFDDNSLLIVIPKSTRINNNLLELDHTYLIEVSDLILNMNNDNSTLVSNWNNGQVVKSKQLKVSLSKIVNNMFRFDGVGTNNDSYMDLWLPSDKFITLKELR